MLVRQVPPFLQTLLEQELTLDSGVSWSETGDKVVSLMVVLSSSEILVCNMSVSWVSVVVLFAFVSSVVMLSMISSSSGTSPGPRSCSSGSVGVETTVTPSLMLTIVVLTRSRSPI